MSKEDLTKLIESMLQESLNTVFGFRSDVLTKIDIEKIEQILNQKYQYHILYNRLQDNLGYLRIKKFPPNITKIKWSKKQKRYLNDKN